MSSETYAVSTEPTQGEAPFRRVLPQILACSACNLLLFDIGLVLSFPTILIGALFENPDEPLSLTSDQSSWFASICMLCQPIGSIISGYLVKPLGWKRSMLLLNIPYLICWTMVYFAETVSMLYSASVVMGLAIGLTEAPMLTYVGEISEPKYRGALSAYCQLYFQIACLVLYGVGAVLSWRYTAAFCACVPVVSALAVSRIPEAPLWLISKGKIRAAENALCWLRGWTKPENVQEELKQLLEYNKSMEQKRNIQLGKASVPAESQGQHSIKFASLRPAMRRPLMVIIWLFFFIYATGLATARPYLMHIYKELRIEMDHYEVTVLIGVVSVVANVACSVAVGYVGKKPISIVSVAGSGLCTLGLALAAYQVLSYSWSLPLLFAWTFVTGLGIFSIPWMLQSELYPYQGKCIAAGFAAAVSYLIGFIAIKTFFDLEQILQLSGTFVLYTCFSIFGVIYIVMRLPETEGRTFEQIESMFKY